MLTMVSILAPPHLPLPRLVSVAKVVWVVEQQPCHLVICSASLRKLSASILVSGRLARGS
jgi:hypothetical protein